MDGAGIAGVEWFNWIGLIVMALMMLPNILYAAKFKDAKNLCTNRTMNIIEQLGRYSCMLLMVFNVGFAGIGFGGSFGAYIAVNAVLLAAYWLCWLLYFKRIRFILSLLLAILPTLEFLLSGILLHHWLLTGCAVLFGIGHIYVTVVNARENSN